MNGQPKRTFAQTLSTLRSGELTDELDVTMRELVKAVDESGKVGTITLTLKLKPTKSGAIELADDIKCKMPQSDKVTTILFPTVEGNLQRNDPAQGELDGLRSVGEDDRPVRKAAAG